MYSYSQKDIWIYNFWREYAIALWSKHMTKQLILCNNFWLALSLPRVHAQGVKHVRLLSSPTKIVRSRVLGIWETPKHNESVDIGEKLLQYASNYLTGPTSVTNSAFCWPRLSTLPMCFLLIHTSLSSHSSACRVWALQLYGHPWNATIYHIVDTTLGPEWNSISLHTNKSPEMWNLSIGLFH